MGKDWDSFVPPPAVWAECMRVLKPGGHMAVFAGARTQDLMGLSIRLAGFEIRDTLGWVYGSGFPKSMDISKAIDKQKHKKDDTIRFTLWLREQCEVLGISKNDLDKAAGTSDMGGWWTSKLPHRCAIPTAEQWESIARFFPALPDWAVPLIAPANQPGEAWEKREVVGVREVPQGHAFAGSTYGGDSSSKSVNVTAPATSEAVRWDGWGTALKPAIEPIVLARKPLDGTVASNVLAHGVGGLNIDASRVSSGEIASDGRWPANVLLDEYAAAEMDKQSGNVNGVIGRSSELIKDSGGASRFFPVFKYQTKAPKKERPAVEREDGTKIQHPTVKPLGLMEWLVTLITPPGGTVLDPFAGTGTTLQAAAQKGFNSIGIEQSAEYVELISQRLADAGLKGAA